MLRYLRIAVTVVSGLCCVLVIVLWVRSYWHLDEVTWGLSSGPGYKFISLNGQVLMRRYPSREGAVSLGWRVSHLPPHYSLAFPANWPSTFCGFSLAFSEGRPYRATSPQWFLAALAGTFAIAPWIPWLKWRFSLRTLLLATTAVALLLGLIIYATRG
jgi:hypothetical protein